MEIGNYTFVHFYFANHLERGPKLVPINMNECICDGQNKKVRGGGETN